MRKTSIIVLAFLLGSCSIMAQKSAKKTPKDSTHYEPRQLSVEEVNFVSGYYKQDGSHSAVTGGIGSEKLTDIANTVDLKLSGVSKLGNKHTFSLEMGVDHYTSASSDKIDPREGRGGGHGGPNGGGQTVIDSALLVSESTRTSASYKDTRFYPSANWSIENPKQHWTLGLGATYSREWDYRSRGLSASFNKRSKDGNRELGIRAGAYLDKLDEILPAELQTGASQGGHGGPGSQNANQKSRNTYETSLSLMQVINRRLQIVLLADLASQSGYLQTSFNRVFFTDASLKAERLPDKRVKTPIGLRINYFAGDRVVLRGYYRFYRDDWGMQAHTMSLEAPIKLNSALSISPNFRYHTQQAIDYFAAYKKQETTAAYFSSDYDLSALHSTFLGMGIRYAPAESVMLPSFSMLELRGGLFKRSDGLSAWILSANLRFK